MSDVVKLENQLTSVMELVLAGATEADILAIGKEKFGLKNKTELGKLLKRVHTEIQSAAEIGRRDALGMAVARLNRLFASALGIQDYKTALSVLKELHRLQGL